MSRTLITLGALAGLLGVMIGAFGAHALREKLGPDMMAVFRTGVEYHFYHALALLAVGVLAHLWPQRVLLGWAGALFVVGILLFSGSLYALAITGIRGLGAITPIGGMAFIVGWLLLLVAAVRPG